MVVGISNNELVLFSVVNYWSIISLMKIKSGLQQLAILVALLVAVVVGYVLGGPLYVMKSPGSQYDAFGFPTLPPFTKLNIPPQTVKGITATIEGVYADPSRIVFSIHLNRELGISWNTETFLAYANGQQIGMSSYMLAPLPEEKLKYLMIFHPVNWLKESRLDGQLSAAFVSSTDPGQFIKFVFNFAIPIQPFKVFHPQKTVTINGVGIFLDKVLVAPADTYMYLCYPNRSDENWILTGENITLKINRQVSNPNMPSPWLFDSTIIEGEQEQFSEPGWAPPNTESRCLKLGFPVGDAHPAFLTLTIPGLENAMTTTVPDDELSDAYEKLTIQGIDMKYSAGPSGTFTEYKKLPEGMTEKEAYHQFMDALGYLHEGPWVFRVFLFR